MADKEKDSKDPEKDIPEPPPPAPVIPHFFQFPNVIPLEDYRQPVDRDTFIEDLGRTAIIIDFPFNDQST